MMSTCQGPHSMPCTSHNNKHAVDTHGESSTPYGIIISPDGRRISTYIAVLIRVDETQRYLLSKVVELFTTELTPPRDGRPDSRGCGEGKDTTTGLTTYTMQQSDLTPSIRDI